MKFSKKSIWLLVSVAVVLFTLSNVVGIIAQDEFSGRQKVILSIMVLFYFALHWVTVVSLSFYLQKRYPKAHQDRIRLAKTYVYGALIVIGTMIFMHAVENFYTGQEKVLPISETLFDTFQGLGIAILLVSLTEAFFQYQKNQQSERENAELTRVNLMAQYNNLKQQVSPHFLFNSLNTLSSLIGIDPERAEAFVGELSVVYRYLLQNSEDGLVSLGKELNFIHSYIHLMKTRFGDGLYVSIDVPSVWNDYQIPPLSLQLLVENAIKHNVISPDQPLRIDIQIAEGQRICVRNNLQKKQQSLPSEKVGLVNIITKYRLLGQGEVLVMKSDRDFCVSLPLVKK